MSHGVRNGIFKALLTLKKIRNIFAKERVLTPSVWRYLTFFWWRYESILWVRRSAKVEISLLHRQMWFLWENAIFVLFWTLYNQETLLFKIVQGPWHKRTCSWKYSLLFWFYEPKLCKNVMETQGKEIFEKNILKTENFK